jgi:predicted nucleotidyltransferase
MTTLTRDSVIQLLRARRDEFVRDYSVKSLALFGSVARNEASEASDVDLLVEFSQPVGLFHLYRLEDRIQQLLGGTEIDLVLRRAVIDELKERIYSEAVDVVN